MSHLLTPLFLIDFTLIDNGLKGWIQFIDPGFITFLPEGGFKNTINKNRSMDSIKHGSFLEYHLSIRIFGESLSIRGCYNVAIGNLSLLPRKCRYFCKPEQLESIAISHRLTDSGNASMTHIAI